MWTVTVTGRGDNPRHIMVYRCFPRKPTNPWFLTSKASASSTAKSTLRGSSLGRAMFHLTPPILWNEVKMKIQFLWESTSQILKFRFFLCIFPVTSRVGEASEQALFGMHQSTRYTDIPYASCFLSSFHVLYTPWNNRNRAFDSIISRRWAKHPKFSWIEVQSMQAISSHFGNVRENRIPKKKIGAYEWFLCKTKSLSKLLCRSW